MLLRWHFIYKELNFSMFSDITTLTRLKLMDFYLSIYQMGPTRPKCMYQ